MPAEYMAATDCRGYRSARTVATPTTSPRWHLSTGKCTCTGLPAPEIGALCGDRALPLHEFSWEDPMKRAGFRRNALYLVRPDGYVALAAAEQSRAVIASYLDARGIR